MAGRGMTEPRKSRGSLTVRWFRRAVPWGTVYLTCDEQHPQRIKIGFTQRKTAERRKELAKLIEEMTEQMLSAATDLRFELAGRLRDEIAELRKELKGMREAGID